MPLIDRPPVNKQMCSLETGQYLNFTDRTLYNWRYKGIGSKFHRLPSGRIFYFLHDIIHWYNEHQKNGYSDEKI